MAVPDPVLTAITRLEERLFERIDERFAGFRRDFQLDLDGRFDAVHHRLDRLEQEYQMIKAGLARLEVDVSELKADVSVLKTDVAVLKGEMSLVKATIERLDARL